jgi:hypothetical protein
MGPQALSGGAMGRGQMGGPGQSMANAMRPPMPPQAMGEPGGMMAPRRSEPMPMPQQPAQPMPMPMPQMPQTPMMPPQAFGGGQFLGLPEQAGAPDWLRQMLQSRFGR